MRRLILLPASRLLAGLSLLFAAVACADADVTAVQWQGAVYTIAARENVFIVRRADTDGSWTQCGICSVGVSGGVFLSDVRDRDASIFTLSTGRGDLWQVAIDMERNITCRHLATLPSDRVAAIARLGASEWLVLGQTPYVLKDGRVCRGMGLSSRDANTVSAAVVGHLVALTHGVRVFEYGVDPCIPWKAKTAVRFGEGVFQVAAVEDGWLLLTQNTRSRQEHVIVLDVGLSHGYSVNLPANRAWRVSRRSKTVLLTSDHPDDGGWIVGRKSVSHFEWVKPPRRGEPVATVKDEGALLLDGLDVIASMRAVPVRVDKVMLQRIGRYGVLFTGRQRIAALLVEGVLAFAAFSVLSFWMWRRSLHARPGLRGNGPG